MTTVNWLIDENIINYHPELTSKMPQIIRDLGYNCFLTKYVPFSDDQDYNNYTDKDCVVLYGTHGYVRKNKNVFVPGAYGVNSNSKCSVYMNHIPREWLLNSNYVMVPWGEFKRRYFWFFELFGVRVLFIRPDSGFKTFAGTVISLDKIEDELQTRMQFTSVTDETIIMVAKPQWIKGEFRFVVCDKQIVAGSEYRWDGIMDLRRDWPSECEELAQKVADQSWQFDKVYCCDIALTNDGPKVIELNSFACAGLYACDLASVVKNVSDVAIKDFNSYWDTSS